MTRKTWLFLALAAVGAFAFIITSQGCFRKAEQAAAAIQILQQERTPDSVQYWRDRAGREHARVVAISADMQTLKLLRGRDLDSIARLNNINARQVSQIISLSLLQSGRHEVQPVETPRTDTSSDVHFTWTDGYMSIDGKTVIENCHLGAVMLSYENHDSLLLTSFRKRRWLLGPRYSQVDAVSMNPNTRITGLGSLVVRDRPKPWGLGVQVGYYLVEEDGILKARPSLGVGLSYNLIRF